MFRWYVIVLAALAVLLLIAGLLALILPEDYEGREIYRLDKLHAIRLLDLLGGVLVIAGCIAAWVAGAIWQRKVDAA
jgi:alkylation response protein AidB-like acyl-CoA dehydrogenase